MRLIHLAAVGLLGAAGYTYAKKEFWPAPTVKISQQKIKNRHEMIRYYERSIADIQETMGRTARVSSKSVDSEGGNPTAAHSHAKTTTVDPRLKQIEEYRRRIAAMKAEIGEQ